MTVWRLTAITKSFGGGWMSSRPGHLALDAASVAVEAGERVGIIGESGAGKTTLARIGLGLVPPDSGTIELFGEDATRWSSSQWRKARRHAQLLFQNPRAMLNARMTLGRLLRESAALHRPEADARAEALRVLEEVGLTGRDRAFPRELSGGERRRAGIARLLLAKPRLVVADEPTAGLDASLKATLIETLYERVGDECSVVLVSHDLPMVAWACHRIVVMRGGRVVDEFRTAELGQEPRHPYTVQLLTAADMPAGRSRAAGAKA